MERTEQLYHGMHSATVVIKIKRVLHFLQQVDPLLTLDHVTLTEEQEYVSNIMYSLKEYLNKS